MSRTWMVGIVGAALVLLAACGRSAPEDQPPPAAKPGGPPSNWEVPLHGSRIVASAKQAARHVHFSVREPHFASRPALIQVDDPAQVPVDDRTVAFVYHLPAAGTVVVEERSAHLTLAELRQRADAPGVPADAFQMVPVRATEGLLVSGSGIGGLLWTEGGVLFDITGPQRQPVTGAGAGRARLSWHRSWHRFDNNLSARRCPQTPAHSTSRTPCTTQCCWSGSRRFARLKITSACNVGLVPVTNPAVSALRRGRLAWVAHHYVRAETIAAANAHLVDHQTTIGLAQAWGGGQLASADGLRFVVPVRTVNAGPNPRYFGTGRGVTWLNYLSDQVTGFAAVVVVPGTIRDSLFILDGLLEQETSLQPEQITTDTASYSDQVFGLFRLLGYQFSPRLADLSDQRFWRMDPLADYGALNGLARSRINTRLIVDNWEDLLRVAGSLATGAVRASDILRVLQGGGRPTTLGRAIAEYGRIAKTLHLLAFVDADESYRRQVGAQLSLQESRHRLARKVFHGQRGELRQRYREGQEAPLTEQSVPDCPFCAGCGVIPSR